MLKLKYDEPLSHFAFKSTMRRYMMGGTVMPPAGLAHIHAVFASGTTTTVGYHGKSGQVEPMKPVLKLPESNL